MCCAERLNADPHNMDLAVQLANAYIDYGRSTGDARYIGRGNGGGGAVAPGQPRTDSRAARSRHGASRTVISSSSPARS